VVTNNVANGMLKDPGACKVMIASWCNFNFSCTGADRWDRRWPRCRSSCTWFTNPSEMTQFADIVLPSTFNSAEGWSIVTNMGNGYGYTSIQQGAVRRFVGRQAGGDRGRLAAGAETEGQGFPNLADYLGQEFKDPETGKLPTNERDFNEIATKISSAPIWMPKEPLKGTPQIKGWAEFRAKGMYSNPRYALKRGWGGKVRHRDEEVRVLQRYRQERTRGARQEIQHLGRRHPGGVRLRGQGEAAFVPHYRAAEAPRQRREYRSPSSTTRAG